MPRTRRALQMGAPLFGIRLGRAAFMDNAVNADPQEPL